MGSKNNMNKIDISKTKYIAVFATTTLIFVAGLLLGNFMSAKKLTNIQALEQDLTTDIMAIEVQYLMLAEDPCMQVNSTPLTDELYKIGSRLDYMENSLGATNINVLRLKEFYSLLQIRHWLLAKKQKKECNLSKEFILYFYSNLPDCKRCKEQGFVLDYLHKKYPELNIYSFDIHISNVALETLKKIFEVKKAPTVIINNIPYEGFKNRDELERLLKK